MIETAQGLVRVLDSDNHYYERYDSFTRHIEPKLADRAVHVAPGPKGRDIVMVGDTPLKVNPAHPEDFVVKPGVQLEQFATGKVDPDLLIKNKMRAEDNPAFIDRDARLKFMDQENLDAAVLYPSLGVFIEEQLSNDPIGTFANMRAFNRWIEDDWGYGEDGRIFSVPMLSLLDIDMAVEELERVLALGARAVHIRAAPINGKSPADPMFDPFWARVDEARIPVAIHASYSPYMKLHSVHWGEDPDPSFAELTPFQAFTCMAERPIIDVLAAFTLHNLFGRFPNVNILSIENGSSWLKALLYGLDKAVVIGRRSRVAPKLDDKPSAILSRHLFISPHPEEDLDELAQVIAPSQITFGSDWPHPEGFAHPTDFAQKLSNFDSETSAAIMGNNAAALLGAW